MTRVGIAVNLLWLAPGRVGGSEEYLVRQLAGLPDDVDVTLYGTPTLRAAHPELTTRFATSELRVRRDSRALRIVAEHSWLSWATRAAAVVHHGGGTAPLGARRPYVLTVHDLQYLTYPEHFGRARLTYLRRMMPRSVRHASVVTAPSAYVRSTVIGAFGADPDRVVVVPHGVPDPPPITDDAIGAARERYRIGPHPYVVYPAISHPHKRQALLVDMLDHLDPDVRLVLLGGVGDGERELQRHVAGSIRRDHVIRPGRVPAADRDVLLAGAEALAFPSAYEGFGAPLVEAMAVGTPIVCSAAAAVPEVVGDAAITVDGADPAAWAAAVDDARARRSELVVRGRERRRRFTPEISGERLAEAYRLAHR